MDPDFFFFFEQVMDPDLIREKGRFHPGLEPYTFT